MDRRDALKKLGMGGAAAVGATMVMSSPAFAAATPTAGGVTASAVADFKSQVTVTITQAPAGCTASATSRTVDWTYSVTGAEIVDIVDAPGTQVLETAVSETVVRTAPASGSGNFSNTTTITVSASSTYTCVFGSGPETLGPVNTSTIFTYASGSGTGNWTPAGTVALA